MGVFSKLFGAKGKDSVIEVLSMSALVNKLKWAEVEVQDTHDALTGLEFRLEHGKLVMEDIADEAATIIAHHEVILAKANARRAEFSAQTEQVKNIKASIKSIYDEVTE